MPTGNVRSTAPVCASSSSSVFDRLPQTYSRAPSAVTAMPAGISASRRGAFAGGSASVCDGATVPSSPTAKALSEPRTLASQIVRPSGDTARPVQLIWPSLSGFCSLRLGSPAGVVCFSAGSGTFCAIAPVAASSTTSSLVLPAV